MLIAQAFTTIVELALNKNKTDLIKLLETFPYSINIYHDHFSPVQLLAEMGKHESVNLLLELGADLEDAVWAYAKAGYVDHVNELISRR